MNDVTLARALHVLAIVLWIGGVGMATTVLLPALRRLPDPVQRIAMFQAVESRFGPQARLSILLAGLSGLYMLVRMDIWDRFTSPLYWWMHAMVVVWLIFALMLFVIEPFVLHRHFAARAKTDPDAAFRTLHRLHVVLLVLALGLVEVQGFVRCGGVIQTPQGVWHGPLCSDRRPVGEDGAALPGQTDRSRPDGNGWATVPGGGAVDCSHEQPLA